MMRFKTKGKLVENDKGEYDHVTDWMKVALSKVCSVVFLVLQGTIHRYIEGEGWYGLVYEGQEGFSKPVDF